MRVSTKGSEHPTWMPVFIALLLLVILFGVSWAMGAFYGALLTTFLTIDNPEWSFWHSRSVFPFADADASPPLGAAKHCFLLACVVLAIAAIVVAFGARNAIDRVWGLGIVLGGALYCIASYRRYLRSLKNGEAIGDVG